LHFRIGAKERRNAQEIAMNLLNHKTFKAAIIALALGAVAVPTLPANAASFSFQFGNGGFFGDHGFSDHDRRGRYRPHKSCLTDYQVRQRVARNGYSNIYLNVANGQHIQVRATRGRWVYLIDFNRCTGRIEDADRLRPARGHGGFGLQFGYGGTGDDKEEAGDLH
jgi:hypothetical protein